MNANVYQVKNWDKFFEGAKSKTYKNKTLCSMPTKHGLGYRRIVSQKHGAGIFGAWCALIQLLSRHDAKREGYCTDTGRIDGVPYTPEDLQMMTLIPAAYFAMMFDICSSQVVDWLDVVDTRILEGYHEDTLVPLNSNSNSNSNSNLYCISASPKCGSQIGEMNFPLEEKNKNQSNLTQPLGSSAAPPPQEAPAPPSEAEDSARGTKTRVRAKHSYSADFEAFWGQYGIGGKKAAFDAWKKQNPSDSEIAEIMKSLPIYKEYCESSNRFKKDGQGWINGRFWETDWAKQPKYSNGNDQNQKHNLKTSVGVISKVDLDRLRDRQKTVFKNIANSNNNRRSKNG